MGNSFEIRSGMLATSTSTEHTLAPYPQQYCNYTGPQPPWSTSVEKVWFSLVHGLFCLNPELDHRFGSQILLNLELDPQFRIKRVQFGIRERVNPKLNTNVKGG